MPQPSATLKSQSPEKVIERLEFVHWSAPDMDDYICRHVETAFPDEFVKLKRSHQRGGWTTRPFDKDGYEGSIFLNRVTLYKLGCLCHKDPNDLLCAISCGGRFIGGELIAPDLGMKFRYFFKFSFHLLDLY